MFIANRLAKAGMRKVACSSTMRTFSTLREPSMLRFLMFTAGMADSQSKVLNLYHKQLKAFRKAETQNEKAIGKKQNDHLTDVHHSKIYTIPQPLNFQNGRYTIFKVDAHWNQVLRHLRIMNTISCFCFFMVYRSVRRCRPIRSVLWSIPTVILTMVDRDNRRHYARVVTRLDLHEDGKHIDIYFSDNGSFLCQDVRSLRLLDKEEMTAHFEDFQSKTSKALEKL